MARGIKAFWLTALIWAAVGAAQEPGQGAPKKAAARKQEKEVPPLPITALTDLRALRSEESGRAQLTAEALLELTPGRGADFYRELTREAGDLPPEFTALLGLAREPSSPLERASPGGVGPDPQLRLLSTEAVPRWNPRPERDTRGRIRGLTDALGNRVTFRYDERGFQGFSVDPRGPYDLRWGDAGALLYEHPRTGTFPRPTVLPLRQLWASPAAGMTVHRVSPRGGHSFTHYDLLGRPVYRVDSRGRLHLNLHGPHGELTGRYDARGRLTLFGQDPYGWSQLAVGPDGTVVLRDNLGAGGFVLRRPDGTLLRGGGTFRAVPPRPQPTPSVPTPPRRP